MLKILRKKAPKNYLGTSENVVVFTRKDGKRFRKKFLSYRTLRNAVDAWRSAGGKCRVVISGNPVRGTKRVLRRGKYTY